METIILPGMGADSSMYPRNKYKNLKQVTFAEWPKYKGETSIKQVAHSVINQYKIRKDAIVGGASLGGMVAVEIAKILKIKKIILICSTTNPASINPALYKLSGLSDIAPIKLVQLLAGKINYHQKNQLLKMFEQSDTEFIRAMSKAVFEWNGIQEYNCEICHIHGSWDKVILPPKENVELIPRGGHLITMTHGELVSEFISKCTKP